VCQRLEVVVVRDRRPASFDATLRQSYHRAMEIINTQEAMKTLRAKLKATEDFFAARKGTTAIQNATEHGPIGIDVPRYIITAMESLAKEINTQEAQIKGLKSEVEELKKRMPTGSL
jgi:hypothetical protein